MGVGQIKPPGDRRFWSMFPFTGVPFWVPIFDQQPHDSRLVGDFECNGCSGSTEG